MKNEDYIWITNKSNLSTLTKASGCEGYAFYYLLLNLYDPDEIQLIVDAQTGFSNNLLIIGNFGIANSEQRYSLIDYIYYNYPINFILCFLVSCNSEIEYIKHHFPSDDEPRVIKEVVK